MKIAEPVLNECEVFLLGNMPQIPDAEAEIAAVAVGSFAMTGRAFLSYTGCTAAGARDDDRSYCPRPQKRTTA
jgi:hypothetical protein